MLAGLAICVGFLLASPGVPAYAQSCDTSGSVDGTADPGFVGANTVVTFTAINFTPNEEVSFWFTTPLGDVVGTAQPLCCAGADGRVGFAPTTMPPGFFAFPGKWALTVQGASSQHQSIIYFCLGVEQQPTPVPATATAAPALPTATTEPPTSVPATSVAASPTAEATTTTLPTVETSPTSVATAPVATVPATTVPATTVPATTVPVATAPVETPTVAVFPTAEVTAQPTPSNIGMPVTGAGGSNDSFLYIGIVLAALSLITMGLAARRAATTRK